MAAKKSAEAPEPGERELVAALLLEPGAFPDVRDLIGPADFLDPRLGSVYRALAVVFDRGDPSPKEDSWLAVLAHEASTNGALTHSAAQLLVYELVDDACIVPPGSYRYYARLVRERALRAAVRFQIRRLELLVQAGGPEEAEAWRLLDGSRAALELVQETDHPLGRSLLYGERLLELSSQPPPATVVPGLLYPGNLTVLVGAPFVGKSFLSLHLSAAQASGVAAWEGLEAPTPGRVLYVAYEGNAADLVRRLRSTDTMTEPKRSPCAWSPNLALLAHAPETSPALLESVKLHAPGIARLSATLRRDGPWVGLVLDTLAAGLPPGLDENDNAAMTLVCSRLQALAQHTGVWVLLVHHPSKAGVNPEHESPIWALGRGAGGIAGTARAIAFLDSMGPGQRRLRFQVNLAATPRPMHFEVAPENAPDEILYWKPRTLESIDPAEYLEPGEWINTTELGYRLARVDRGEKLPGDAQRRAASVRIRWIALGLVDCRQGARNAQEIRLRATEEIPF